MAVTKHSRAALLGLALAAGSAIAQAAPYTEQEALGIGWNDALSLAQSLGSLPLDGTLSVDGSRMSNVAGGSSTDFYSVVLPQRMWLTLTLTPDSASAMPVLGLFQGSSVANGTLASALDNDASDGLSRLTFNLQLDPGTYYAGVMGYRNHWWDFDGGGNAGWNYRLTMSGWSTVASPVPEASTLAMMLSGLGLIGLASRRRSTRR